MINVEKTKILHLRNKNTPISNYEFKCGDELIDFNNSYRYLGLHFNEFVDFEYMVRGVSNSASRALSALYTRCGGMTYDVLTKLYQSLVEPVLYHGAGLWGQTKCR